MTPSDSIPCAQTNIQLYSQLTQAGWGEEDLLRARRGYELATELFAGRFRPMGKPFVCHLVGVASLVERSGGPARAVQAGLVHSAYPQGDFGGGANGSLPAHQQRVREAIGPEAEELVALYASWKEDDGLAALQAKGQLGEAERATLLIELMDTLEEHQDDGIVFCQKAGTDEKRDATIAASLEAAGLIERPELGEELRTTITRTYENRPPAALVSDHRSSFTLGAPPQRRSLLARLRSRPAD